MAGEAAGEPHQPPPLYEESELGPSVKLPVSKSGILHTTVPKISSDSVKSSTISSSNPVSPVSKSGIPHTTVSKISSDSVKSSTISPSNPVSPVSPASKHLRFGQVTAQNLTLSDEGKKPTTTRISFLEAAKHTTIMKSSQGIQDIDFTIKPVTLFQGKPAIAFNCLEKSKLLDGLRFVLVGKFTHGRPSMLEIQQFFNTLKLKEQIQISLLDKKHIIIRCHNKPDFYYLWLKLQWSIKGFTMRIFKWDSEFSPSKESSIAPVWIRITNLPFYFFESKTLLSIANVIGNPILIDPKSVSRTDVSAARLCVELDVAKTLIDAIWINFEDVASRKVLGGFWAKVYYDVVPPYCLDCFHIGHGITSCKRRLEDKAFEELPIKKSYVDTMVPAPPTVPSSQQSDSDLSIPDDVGAFVVAVQKIVEPQGHGATSQKVLVASSESTTVEGDVVGSPLVADHQADSAAFAESVVGTIQFSTAPVKASVTAAISEGGAVVIAPQGGAVVAPQAVLQQQPIAASNQTKAHTSLKHQQQQFATAVHGVVGDSDTTVPDVAAPSGNEDTVSENDVEGAAAHSAVQHGGVSAEQAGQSPISLEADLDKATGFVAKLRFCELSSAVEEGNFDASGGAGTAALTCVVPVVGAETEGTTSSVHEPAEQLVVAAEVSSDHSNHTGTATTMELNTVAHQQWSQQVLYGIDESPITVVPKDVGQESACPVSVLGAPGRVSETVADEMRNWLQNTDTWLQITDKVCRNNKQGTPTTPVEASPRNEASITTTTAAPILYAADRKQISNVQHGNWVSDVRQNSVTTRAQAKKLASEQHKQQQIEKTSVRKSKEHMQNKDITQRDLMISQDKNDSVKKIWDQIGLNLKLYDPSTVKPQRTKDGCPVVVFKQEDVNKWMARQKEREKEQMRGQGLPFDDKG